MIVTMNEHCCLVQPEGEKFYNESRLWYHIQQALKKQSYDVIKKEMVKDQHPVSGGEYYIRDRKWGWYLRDDYFCIRPIYETFNAGKTLHLTRGYF